MDKEELYQVVEDTLASAGVTYSVVEGQRERFIQDVTDGIWFEIEKLQKCDCGVGYSKYCRYCDNDE